MSIRVFGEPSKRVKSQQTTDTKKLSEVHILEQQVHMLQKQLELVQEREQFQRDELKAKNGQLQAKDEQIEALQRLLCLPKLEKSTEQMSESSKDAVQQTPTEDKPVEEKQKLKRVSLFSRVISPMIDERILSFTTQSNEIKCFI